jgi:hypothetical protein
MHHLPLLQWRGPLPSNKPPGAASMARTSAYSHRPIRIGTWRATTRVRFWIRSSRCPLTIAFDFTKPKPMGKDLLGAGNAPVGYDVRPRPEADAGVERGRLRHLGSIQRRRSRQRCGRTCRRRRRIHRPRAARPPQTRACSKVSSFPPSSNSRSQRGPATAVAARIRPFFAIEFHAWCSRRKPRMELAIASTCVPSAKCPVGNSSTWALGLSRRYALAPAGMKNGSRSPQMARMAAFSRASAWRVALP